MTTVMLDRRAETIAPAMPSPAGPARLLDTRFGAIPLDTEQQILFRGGLPGFPDHEHYQLNRLSDIETELLLLQALDSREVGFFVMTAPHAGSIIRQTDIGAVCRSLSIAAGDLLLLLVVTFAKTPKGVEKYVNLRAPVFVDVRTRQGAQIVLPSSDYPLRFNLSQA